MNITPFLFALGMYIISMVVFGCSAPEKCKTVKQCETERIERTINRTEKFDRK